MFVRKKNKLIFFINIYLCISFKSIICIPESVDTGSDISSTYKLNPTSSNSFYISPLLKKPKSPF